MATKKAAKKSPPKKTAKKTATKPAVRKTAAKKTAAKGSTTPPSKRWSAKVKTDSTKPATGLFKKSAKAIAAGLSKKSVAPKGPGQAMQMLNFYENRGGKNLPPQRKHALEGAKKILHEEVQQSHSKRSS